MFIRKQMTEFTLQSVRMCVPVLRIVLPHIQGSCKSSRTWTERNRTCTGSKCTLWMEEGGTVRLTFTSPSKTSMTIYHNSQPMPTPLQSLRTQRLARMWQSCLQLTLILVSFSVAVVLNTPSISISTDSCALFMP